MPRILALETSTSLSSVALADESSTLVSAQFPQGLRHAAALLPLVDSLCKEVNWNPRDFTHIYISQGPGSFTGLRIGVTFAKTLAFASSAKIVGVPSDQVLAENAPPDATNVMILLDARRGKIFTSLFTRTNLGWRQTEPIHLDTVSDALARAPRPLHILGEGIPFHSAQLPPDVIITPQDSWRPRVESVLKIGRTINTFIDPMHLTPIYIRLPEAEEKWLAEHPL